MAPYDLGMQKVSVFLTYSHDSDEHRSKVIGLSGRLRNALLNQNIYGTRACFHWKCWHQRQIIELRA